MPETINWNFVTQVLQGPSISASASIDDVDAYDKFDVTITDSATQTVNLVPADSIGRSSQRPSSTKRRRGEQVFVFVSLPFLLRSGSTL